MSVQGKSEVVWMVENCIVPSLKTIRKANSFSTDVDEVLIPDYSYFDEDKESVLAAIESSAIQLWVRDIADSRTVAGGMLGGDRHWSFECFFIGGIRGGKNLQARAVTFAEDHKQVIDTNPQNDQPGGSLLNTWGINATLSERYRFDLYSTDHIGAWSCAWRFDYRQPTG